MIAEARLTWGGNLRAQQEADDAFRRMMTPRPKPPKAKREHTRRKKPKRRRYWKYLKSPHWLEVREAAIKHYSGKCCRCGDQGREVHHKHYRTVGRESMEDVELLCGSCHDDQHEEKIAPDEVTRRFRELAL